MLIKWSTKTTIKVRSEKSVMLKHSHDKHEGKFVQFSMKIVKKHYSAFQRLVHEAVRIDRNSRDKNISSLNSKSEYGRGHLPLLMNQKMLKLIKGMI